MSADDGRPGDAGSLLHLGGASATFTRAGAGEDPLRGNLGLHVGDDPARVHRRRAALSGRLGRPVLWMDQTHSTRVLVVAARGGVPVVSPADAGGGEVGVPRDLPGEWGPLACDAVVVDARDWPGAPAAAVMVADCLPVLLASSDGTLVAAVHAGRRGLDGGILTRAVAAMATVGVGADGLHALIGPAICGRCYEVPDDLRERVAGRHPAARATTSWGTPSLDLTAGAVEEVRAAGVPDVRAVGECTRESADLHSHRRDPRGGRQAGVVVPAGL